MKRAAATAPAPRGELVVRQSFVIDATNPRTFRAVPEVLLLGDADAFRTLAALFTQLAEAADRGDAPAPELERPSLPINTRLSDDLALRFVPLHDAARSATFKRLGVTLRSRQEGSLFDRYQEVAQEFRKLQARLAPAAAPPAP